MLDEKRGPATVPLSPDELERAIGSETKAAGPTQALSPEALAHAIRDARATSLPPSAPAAPSPQQVPAPSPRGAWSEAFAETDRLIIERIEHLLAGGQLPEAVLRCAALVDKLLPTEAKDRSAAALLMGIEGHEWLRFQHAVQTARCGGHVSTRTALECFAFALSANARWIGSSC